MYKARDCMGSLCVPSSPHGLPTQLPPHAHLPLPAGVALVAVTAARRVATLSGGDIYEVAETKVITSPHARQSRYVHQCRAPPALPRHGSHPRLCTAVARTTQGLAGSRCCAHETQLHSHGVTQGEPGAAVPPGRRRGPGGRWEGHVLLTLLRPHPYLPAGRFAACRGPSRLGGPGGAAVPHGLGLQKHQLAHSTAGVCKLPAFSDRSSDSQGCMHQSCSRKSCQHPVAPSSCCRPLRSALTHASSGIAPSLGPCLRLGLTGGPVASCQLLSAACDCTSSALHSRMGSILTRVGHLGL